MEIYKIWLTDDLDNTLYLNDEFESRDDANNYVKKLIKKNKYTEIKVFKVSISEEAVKYRLVDVYFN